MRHFCLFCWALDYSVSLVFIKPRKPTQSLYIEHFNRTYRDEVLYMCVFKISTELREIADNWIHECNEERPHVALGNLTLSEYLMVNNL